jgi:hypothetical protein
VIEAEGVEQAVADAVPVVATGHDEADGRTL